MELRKAECPRNIGHHAAHFWARSFIASDTEMIPGISADKFTLALPRGGG
jgi:hypothetical protein